MVDHAGIGVYYARLAPRLANYLVATGSDGGSAADLVQESFLRLWKMREELIDDEMQVSGLVFTIAKNLRRDRHRKDARMILEGDLVSSGGESEGQPLSKVVAPETGSVASPDDRAYLRRRLVEAMGTLPPLLREAYGLFQVGGLSIREIARRTNASESLVKVRIFRAKRKLRPLLDDLL